MGKAAKYTPIKPRLQLDWFTADKSNLLELITLREETFAGRNVRDFRDFGLFQRKFLPGKKLNLKFVKGFFPEKSTFSENHESFFDVLKA